MLNTLDLVAHGPVIPVIVLQRVQDAVPLAEALVAGGVRVLEVTMRTPVALQCIEAIAKAVPQAIVGAVLPHRDDPLVQQRLQLNHRPHRVVLGVFPTPLHR